MRDSITCLIITCLLLVSPVIPVIGPVLSPVLAYESAVGYSAAGYSTAGNEKGILVFGDTNRDGTTSLQDIAGRDDWRWDGGGAFILANVDDDDGDGRVDALDRVVNGGHDEKDLAEVHVVLSGQVLQQCGQIRLTVMADEGFAEKSTTAGVLCAPMATDSGAASDQSSAEREQPVTVFRKTSDGWEHVLNEAASREHSLDELSLNERIVEFGLESRRFASESWNGLVTLKAEALAQDGSLLQSDRAIFRVAPWIMLPNSAGTERVHIATGAYSNANMIGQLRDALWGTSAKLATPYRTGRWQEMWMQDTMEIGYTQLPGREPMHVVLQAMRGADSYPPRLLGRDMGFIKVGTVRNLTGGDAWADWYGNLEVSHPTLEYPLGRIYYGCNTTTGVTLHPEVVAFLEAQEVQPPFWVDTSWLIIKHVDEIFNFLPGRDGRGYLCVASPAEAARYLPAEVPLYDHGPGASIERRLIFPDWSEFGSCHGTWSERHHSGEMLGSFDAYNRDIQLKIDRMMHGGTYIIGGQVVQYPGVIALLGIDSGRVIDLPVLYRDGHNIWSNPVNSIFVNGYVIAGDTDMPGVIKNALSAAFRSSGVEVKYLDDSMYQHRLGNVHCATNTQKTPLYQSFWNHLPILD